MTKNNEKDNKKNVILLTLIALFTMIVVVIGATFAYLASSVDTSKNKTIAVNTNATSDLLLINIDNPISISANTTNFGKKPDQMANDLKSSTAASVFLQTVSETEINYDYKISIKVDTNDLEYTSGICYRKSSVVEALDENSCKENNASNIWAKYDGGNSLGCFTPDAEENTELTDEVHCLTSLNNIWEVSKEKELYVDLYTTDNTIDNEPECSAGDYIWDGSICYNSKVTTESIDLTDIKAGESIILKTDNIAASRGHNTRHEYYAVVTLDNKSHNQIVNSNKSFKGSLQIERVIAE